MQKKIVTLDDLKKEKERLEKLKNASNNSITKNNNKVKTYTKNSNNSWFKKAGFADALILSLFTGAFVGSIVTMFIMNIK